MNKTRKLTFTAIIAAITTISSSIVYIPLGVVKAFPIQHFANILSAVLLGPWYSVLLAFLASTLRILLGTGTIFAYPGSMIGAFLASTLFVKTKKLVFAGLGEVIGTGIIGAMATYPIAVLFLGQETTLFGLVPAFAISSFTGAIMGYGLLKRLYRNHVLGHILS